MHSTNADNNIKSHNFACGQKEPRAFWCSKCFQLQVDNYNLQRTVTEICNLVQVEVGKINQNCMMI